MPYAQTTLAQLSAQLATLLDDPLERYWVPNEKFYALWEGLRVFGAYSNYWRSRGTFNLNPSAPTTFVDLSVALPALRTRTWTLNQMVQEIQYMLLEAPGGVAGTGMSGQISVGAILSAIEQARNQFVMDVRFPLSVHSAFASPPPPDGLVTFSDASVYVHRVAWQDQPLGAMSGGAWTNLWREDSFSVDRGDPTWTVEPGMPQQYSESELAPLQLQISPPPVNAGSLEALTVDSLQLDLTNPAQTFNVPDEWTHAIKYAALSDLFQSQNQIADQLRAQYCEERYKQAVDFAKVARSIMQARLQNVPLPIDSLQAQDAGQPFWRNQLGPPSSLGVLYDMVTPNQLPDQAYGISVDVVRSAPLPAAGDYVQLGQEDLDNLLNYAAHVLCFKCGGNEFTSTMIGYDSYMKGIAGRKGINAAKIRYLEPLFGVPQREWAARPDRMEVANA